MKKYINLCLLTLVGLLGVNNAIANNTLWETRSYKYSLESYFYLNNFYKNILLNDVVKANNDLIKTSIDGGVFNILDNDTFNNGTPGQGFILTGASANVTVQKVSEVGQSNEWPAGISINETGQLVIASGASIPLGKSLEYKICTTSGQSCSNAFITFEIPIEGKTDSYLWNASTIQYPSVVANDVFKVNHVVTPIVLSGANKNVTVSQNGSWPTGITLNTITGEINVASGTPAPSVPLKYNLCVDGTTICQVVSVVFLKAETPYSGWNPGSIKIDHQYVCYNGTAVIENEVMGVGSGLIGEGPFSLLGRRYSWEISFDGGLTWKNTDELLNVPPSQEGDGGSESASGGVGDIIVDGANKITISNVTNDFYVRRKANIYHTTAVKRFNSYTAPILVKAQKENEIKFQNDVNSFALALGQNFTLPTVSTHYKSKIEYFKINPSNGTTTLILNPENPIVLPEGSHEYLIRATTVNTGGNSSTLVAPKLNCETTAIVKVMVYNALDCFNYTKRTFATLQNYWSSGLSGVVNPSQAVTTNMSNQATINRANAATLTGGVVLLGIGTVGIDLYFTDPNTNQLYSGTDLKGKKVVVKLGEQYSGLKLAGGISVIPRLTRTGVTAAQIQAASSTVNQGTAILPILADSNGKTVGVKGGVLDALKGDNVFEFSFIPSKLDGTLTEFNGVRIQLGSLLGVADLGSVFYAYIEEDAQIINGHVQYNNQSISYCDLLSTPVIVSPPSSLQYPTNQRDVDVSEYVKPNGESINNTNITLNPFIEDATWGNYSEVLNVASGLSSVVFPYYALDNDYDSYSLFNATAGVLNRQFLKAKFKQLARPGDQIQITLAYPNLNVLNLSLLQLGNFKIVYYLKGAVVGEEKLEQFRVLDLGLFRFRDKRRAVLSRPVNFMYDEVELQQFNTVSVNLGDGLHVHDIRINPLNAFVGMDDPKQVTQLCAIEPLEIQKPDVCTTYELSFARVTEFGGIYQNADGSPMLDFKGNPIRMITAVEDIPNSTLAQLPNDLSGFKARYDLNLTQLFSGPDFDGKLLIKIQTRRQGCSFGDPQYLRVEVENCAPGFVNPVLKSNANY